MDRENSSLQNVWTNQSQAVFDKRKHIHTIAPVLAHPHYDRELILDIDGSATGIGAVQSQVHKDCRKHVVAYMPDEPSANQNAIIV